MKTCTKCKKSKPLNEFSWRIVGRTRRGHCRDCQSEISKSWYKANTNRHNKNVRKNSAKYNKRIRKFVAEYLLSHPCVDCGEDDMIILDFDHRDPTTKTLDINKMIHNCTRSLESIQHEIAKCDVRCAGCHRRRTAKQFGSWRLVFCPRSSIGRAGVSKTRRLGVRLPSGA